MRKSLVNDGRHVFNIMTTTTCRKHNAAEAMPCFEIFPGSNAGEVLHGVCGARIKRAGYNGQVNPLSLRLRTPGGRSGGRKR